MKKMILLIIVLLMSTTFYSQISNSVGATLENGKTTIKQKDKSKNYVIITNYKPTMKLLNKILGESCFTESGDTRWYFIPKIRRKK